MRIIKHRSPITLAAIAALTLSACGDDATSSSDSVERPTTDVSASSTESPATTDHTDDVRRSSAPATTPTSVDVDEIDIVEETTPPSTARPALTPTPTEATLTTSPPDDTIINSSMVQYAIADLRERIGDPDASITVVSVEEVTWRDGSLGCPRPDTRYIQVLINGSRIRLVEGGVAYQYHAASDGDPFYCANPQEPLEPGGGTGDI